LRLNKDSVEDGRLHAYEVFQLDLTERMALLNACETGRGQAVQGQGVLSMGYAFQVALCPTIVMSLWEIDDGATREIFDGFYEQLAAKQPASLALHAGMLQYLDNGNGDDFKHPANWAPFVMVGDGEQCFAPAPKPWWYLLVGGLPWLLLPILIWLWRTRNRQPDKGEAAHT
jgi:CHAT domain-containing protein